MKKILKPFIIKAIRSKMKAIMDIYSHIYTSPDVIFRAITMGKIMMPMSDCEAM